jgi:hypothetical protein
MCAISSTLMRCTSTRPNLTRGSQHHQISAVVALCARHPRAAHAAAVALFLAEGFGFDQLRGFGAQSAPPEGLGLSLAGTYAAWILIMAALYPACRWFANVKRRRQDWWLSYL